jgi:hypothetical protein
MSIVIPYNYYGNIAARNSAIQYLYQRYNNKYIYIYNNADLSNKDRNNNLLFILDTVKYKILVINKYGFTEDLDLFNKVNEININYIGPRKENYYFFKIKSLYNNYKFKFIFNNSNNKSYFFIKNTSLRTKKKRKYIVYTTYYMIKDDLVIPPPVYTPCLTKTNTIIL